MQGFPIDIFWSFVLPQFTSGRRLMARGQRISDGGDPEVDQGRGRQKLYQ